MSDNPLTRGYIVKLSFLNLLIKILLIAVEELLRILVGNCTVL
jgi:hypothetical protein